MKKNIISITTGDIDGIGLEVTLKALSQYKKNSSIFIIFRGPRFKSDNPILLPKKITLSTSNLDTALTEVNAKKSGYKFIEVLSDSNPALWVKESINLCLTNQIDGIVTGPVSKKTFIDAKLDTLGHTPLLKELCKVTEVYMGFLGPFFNVILLTGHIPLNEVESKLTPEAVKLALNIINKWKNHLPKELIKKPGAILGLNPHSGENGLIGKFERKILGPILKENPNIKGPLVPDVAFSKENWKKFSYYIALYHDQGLIPFKMIHGHLKSCHVSVGLPIIRTSVDHGTAKDIFGKGFAHPGSMKTAIEWCEHLIKTKEV